MSAPQIGHVHSALLVCLPNPWYGEDRGLCNIAIPHTTTLYKCTLHRDPPALPICSQVLEGQWGCAWLFHYHPPPPPLLALLLLVVV